MDRHDLFDSSVSFDVSNNFCTQKIASKHHLFPFSGTLIVVVILISIGTIFELIDYFAEKERSKASSKDNLMVVKGAQEHAAQLRNALEVNGIETMSQQSQEHDPRESLEGLSHYNYSR